MKNKNPIAILLSDVHYDLSTLEIADKATRMAIDKANVLKIPLIVAGDLHNSKANLRGECVNAMITTFGLCPKKPVFILRGNHDALHERAEEHSLNFLRPYVRLIEQPGEMLPGVWGVPYCHDTDLLKFQLKLIPKTDIVIMHQGIEGSFSGDYIQDKSALKKDDVAGRRIVSGHYHRRQTIALPDGGQWDYIGNPFSINYGEANDPPKGFQVLYDDGSLEFVPTNLRKHVVIDVDLNKVWENRYNKWGWKGQYTVSSAWRVGDLIWVKVSGTQEQLANVTKESFGIMQDFRLELIPLDQKSTKNTILNQNLTNNEILDQAIESLTNTSEEQKQRVKNLWRTL